MTELTQGRKPNGGSGMSQSQHARGIVGLKTAPVRYRKYQPDLLIAMFRKAAALRNEMLEAGFTDNGGAIHSAERILNLLGLCLKYSDLSHINNLRHSDDAEFSVEAWKLYQNGDRVLIEHVSPIRHLTRMAIDKIGKKTTDDQFKAFVKRHYKLLLLSPSETQRLNRQNRSMVDSDRINKAGIRLATRKTRERANEGGNSRASNEP
ncbi:MAG: hypothetical protein WA700_09360 [Acidobacteriaceae bacterium]